MSSLGNNNLSEALAALQQVRLDGAAPDGAAIDSLFENLRGQLELVLKEHAGMADELLRAYEQLGIVFEITRNLPTARSEEAVVNLFIDSLKTTYYDNEIRVVDLMTDDLLRWRPEPPPAVHAAGDAVRECIQTRRVVVHALPAAIDGVTEIMAAPVFAGEDPFCAIVFTHTADARAFVASDMSLVEALMLFCGDVLRNYHLANELRRLSVDMVRALVNAIDQKDAYTSGHSNRVGYFARLLGAELGLSDDELQMLEWAALLHDVGKIGIRDDVLKKPGKLTDAEFEHIKEHPVRSYEVVRDIPQLEAALDGVRHHHEHWDGSGYPDGLAGDDIPRQARIIQVADIFDALTTSRSYRKAFDPEKALSILREEAGRVVDPQLVPIFEHVLRREIEKNEVDFECGAPAPALEGESA